MSDSDSDTGVSALPTGQVIEAALRNAVKHLFETDQLEELTVKRVRTRVTKELKLPEDYLKNDDVWKPKSKEIIEEESAASYAHAEDPAAETVTLQSKSRRPHSAPLNGKGSAAPSATRSTQDGKLSQKTKGTKRPSPSPETKPGKRQKKAPTPDESSTLSELPSSDDGKEGSAEGRKAVVGSAKSRTSPKSNTKKEDHLGDESSEEDVRPRSKPAAKDSGAGDASESEMSEVLDDAPVTKKKQRRKSSAEKQTRKSKDVAKRSKVDSKVDPQEVEIKRLQGWLLKCGIRRLWYKELAPYDSPRAKINHLKDVLKEVGMEGRYSAEKANAIMEARELQADLAAVQDGAKRWGNKAKNDSEGDDDESESPAKPKRRLARGLRDLEFLGDNDGEEDSD
ncbi:MAG: beta-adaptin [Chaenotheca gracillima]|nr:MAG: beta-adaptin [Chaenotheca gracillima]